jgi:hypothetical protein
MDVRSSTFFFPLFFLFSTFFSNFAMVVGTPCVALLFAQGCLGFYVISFVSLKQVFFLIFMILTYASWFSFLVFLSLILSILCF